MTTPGTASNSEARKRLAESARAGDGLAAHGRVYVRELGYERARCGTCEVDWPCSVVAEAREKSADGIPSAKTGDRQAEKSGLVVIHGRGKMHRPDCGHVCGNNFLRRPQLGDVPARCCFPDHTIAPRHSPAVVQLIEQARAEGAAEVVSRLADAWDAGYDAGDADAYQLHLKSAGYIHGPTETPNPYRAALRGPR